MFSRYLLIFILIRILLHLLTPSQKWSVCYTIFMSCSSSLLCNVQVSADCRYLSFMCHQKSLQKIQRFEHVESCTCSLGIRETQFMCKWNIWHWLHLPREANTLCFSFKGLFQLEKGQIWGLQATRVAEVVRKIWTRTKILSSYIRYLVAIN